MSAAPASVRAVVEAGLCIGCGLCEAVAPERWRMAMTPEGRLRPAPLTEAAEADGGGGDAAILAACPGAIATAPPPEPGADLDPIWGAHRRMITAWAGDPDVRFRAATGGVLTALGAFLLDSGRAEFVLHVAPDPAAPMRSRAAISETGAEVIARAGSRYGPADPLSALETALERAAPFAIIAKPCDAAAVYARAAADPRLSEHLVALLVMVCGGASDLGKSQAVLDEAGVAEPEVTLFRYRGYGNPGRTRIETRDGRAFEKTYQDMWADEAGWRIQTRCKLCPDALGEAADIAAADVWPDAQPSGEDAGFNGVVARTARGVALLDAAVEAGALTLGEALDPRVLDATQPHQVAKKRALAARLRGLMEAGSPVYAHQGLRLETLDAGDAQEQAGAATRVRSGRFREALPDWKKDKR